MLTRRAKIDGSACKFVLQLGHSWFIIIIIITTKLGLLYAIIICVVSGFAAGAAAASATHGRGPCESWTREETRRVEDWVEEAPGGRRLRPRRLRAAIYEASHGQAWKNDWASTTTAVTLYSRDRILLYSHCDSVLSQSVACGRCPVA